MESKGTLFFSFFWILLLLLHLKIHEEEEEKKKKKKGERGLMVVLCLLPGFFLMMMETMKTMDPLSRERREDRSARGRFVRCSFFFRRDLFADDDYEKISCLQTFSERDT